MIFFILYCDVNALDLLGLTYKTYKNNIKIKTNWKAKSLINSMLNDENNKKPTLS